MLKFFEDYDQLHPAQPDPAPQPEQGAAISAGVTADDMRTYFDAMKENLLNEIRDQMQALASSSSDPGTQTPVSDPTINNNEGGQNNASKSDL